MPDDDAQYESLTPAHLGLPDDVPLPLRFTPGHSWSPLVISFPHVGLQWPKELDPRPRADFARNADFEVQRLYEGVQRLGIATVQAVYSRLVVDLNRAPDDISSLIVPDHPAPRPRKRPGLPPAARGEDHGHRLDRPGRGVVWASAVGPALSGPVRILDQPLTFEQFEHRIARYHAPYFRALSVLLERRRARFGYAVLLDAHSMPSSVGLDLVLGTLDGSACAPEIEQAALGALSTAGSGLGVRLNDPYRGGEVVRQFGKPHEGLHALQLEVRRGLYMEEQTSRLWTAPPSHADVLISGVGLGGGTSGANHRATSGSSGLETTVGANVPGVPTSEPKRVDPPSARAGRELADLLDRIRSLCETLARGSRSLRSQRPSDDPPVPARSGA